MSVLCVVLLAVSSTQAPAPSPEGTWKYDVSTLKLVFNAETKKRMAKASASDKASMTAHKQELINLLGKLRLNFNGDHRLVVAAKINGHEQVVTGTWKMKGLQVLVTLNKNGVRPPQLRILPGGAKMHVKFDDPGLGTSTVDMVRAKR